MTMQTKADIHNDTTLTTQKGALIFEKAKINSKVLASLTTWKKRREKGGKQVIEQKEFCSGKRFELACLVLLTALSLVLSLICALLVCLSLSFFLSPAFLLALLCLYLVQ